MKILNKISVVVALAIAITLGLAGPITVFAATSPTLGTVGSYSVLGHTTVTNTGNTTMPGDLGISIGGAPTGFPPGTVGPPGTIRNAGDSLAAQNADTAAFLALSAAPNVTCDASDPTIDTGLGEVELDGKTLTPGVYCADAFHLSGALLLDAQGDPDAVWIFRSELSTLITSSGVDANVQFVEGVGSPCNVWWKVASSATIGAGTEFIGNILALTSITMETNANLQGRVLTQTGAVTLDDNTITGASCLTASTFGSTSTTPTPIVPKLPNTGIGSDEQNIPWNIVIMTGLFTASILFIVARRKSKI